jgi:uncharacterized membrane protein YheB (UPF0754 family)
MGIIIPVFVGAVIGYITNWLAIKMLFRPYREKKILGFKLPFTPGLIPKEKERIAKSVGDTVGIHLLTPEAIKQVLSNNGTNEQVDLWLVEKFNSLKDKEESIGELIEDENKLNEFVDKASDEMTSFIVNEIKEQELSKEIIEFLEQNIYDYIFEKGIGELKFSGDKYIKKVLNSEDTKKIIEITILNKLEKLNSDDRSLKECLPENILKEIKDLLMDNKHTIGNGVRNMFNDSNVYNRLKNSISHMVNENLSPMITMFINSDQISDKILQIVEKYINDPKSTDDYVLIIYNGINKLMDAPLSDLLSSLKQLMNESDIDNLSTKILSQISDEQISRILDIIENNLMESKDVLKERFLQIISNQINEFINSEELYNGLRKCTRSSIDSMIDKPIKIILKDADENTFNDLVSFIKPAFNTFAENELPRLMELLNVSEIVERQINSFDVEYTENLILEIANKELKAITWLGALLGGIMGMLSPLLQML